MEIDFQFNGPTVEAFTCGDCWLLALHLWQDYGYEPIGFFFDKGGLKKGYWCHIAVLTEEGQVLDITGIHDISEMEKEWGPSGTGERVRSMLLIEDSQAIFPDWDAEEHAFMVHNAAMKAASATRLMVA